MKLVLHLARCTRTVQQAYSKRTLKIEVIRETKQVDSLTHSEEMYITKASKCRGSDEGKS